MRAAVAAAEPFINVLRNVLSAKRRGERPSESDYDNPSWAHKQAHRNGFNEAINMIESFLPDQRTK